MATALEKGKDGGDKLRTPDWLSSTAACPSTPDNKALTPK